MGLSLRHGQKFLEKVRRLLSPEARRQARGMTSVSDRLALRAKRRGDASPDVFMPRSPYLSLVQAALEQRLDSNVVNSAFPQPCRTQWKSEFSLRSRTEKSRDQLLRGMNFEGSFSVVVW